MQVTHRMSNKIHLLRYFCLCTSIITLTSSFNPKLIYCGPYALHCHVHLIAFLFSLFIFVIHISDRINLVHYCSLN